jgi:hypothetical protein
VNCRVVVLLAVGLGAGSVVGGRLVAQAPSPVEHPNKQHAVRFEAALRTAVELAGQRLAQQARQVAPDLILQGEPAVARGVKLASYGFYFDVQAPEITSTLLVWDMMQRPRTGPQPVRNGGVVPPATNPAIVPFDPDQAYTTYVKEALVDALLDDSAILPLGAGESLTVAVSGIDHPNSNPLYRTSSARLVMTIRSESLVELRQGRITREQARERVAFERF